MSNNAKNLPEVKLGQYKGLAVTRHVRPLSEKTIDQEMVHQTRMHSVYHNSTAPAKRGSRVLLDFVGFMDGEEIPDSRMEKVMVVLGDGKLMPAAEDAIYGHTAGETFRFDFTYPEQFRVEELSGKTAQFEIKLHSVAEKATPELNEEFARAQGYADLAAMREAVRAKKRKIHEDAADRAAGQELLAKAGANLTVDLPEAMLDRTADNEMRMLEQRLSRSNITLEKHCKNSHTTAAALRAGYRDAAERNLRSMLASRSIAEAENITVSTLEVNNEYRRLSQLQDTPEADIRRVLSPDTLAAALVAQKVQRFLLDNADITHHFGCGKGVNYGLFYTHRDGYADENYPSRDQPPPVLEPASPSQALHRVQGYLPLWRTDLYPPEPCEGLGPLYRVRPVCLCLPQRLHHPFAGAGAAGHLCRRYRQ